MTADELAAVAFLLFEQEKLELTEDARRQVRRTINENRQWIKGNARSIRNFVHKVIMQQNLRLLEQSHRSQDELRTIILEDVQGVPDIE